MGESREKSECENTSRDFKLSILKTVLGFYTIVTLPIYFLIQRPWKTWKAKRTIWGKHVREDDPYSPVERAVMSNNASFEGISTLEEMFRMAVIKHGNRECLGAREMLDEIEELDKTGKILKKLKLGDYHWLSYKDLAKSVEKLSKGLLALGLQPKQPIIIFAETRREWFLTLHACFRVNIPVATLYATLGEEGILYAINETEVSTIVTSQGLLPKLNKNADKIPLVKNIICMESNTPIDANGFPSNISIFRLSEIERMGANSKNATNHQPPYSNDVAIIMYTSGSTGIPKGVLISHKNMLATLSGMRDVVPYWNETDVAISYLPLAHAYEIIMECLYLHIGIPIGYASPYTITDTSTGLMIGCRGDVSLLRPTIFCAVPLLLDRLVKGINGVISAKGDFARQFFKYAVEYKTFWWEKGFSSPILNKLVFRKVQQILGGRVKYVICGAAHLSTDTQAFIRTCFNVTFFQGYGLTETASSGAGMGTTDYSTGRVGAPYFNSYVKLVDWKEGGYKPTDKPHSRGEILIGGPCVTIGYFKNEKLTNEVYTEEEGKRWFYTGDIGEIFPDGTLKIIDRKKDLHKLQRGEYVSLGKVEAEMKTSSFIDNMCAIGSNAHDYLVALITPNANQLQKLANTLGKKDSSFTDLCQDKDILRVFSDHIRDHGKSNGLQNCEIPQKLKLCFEEWLPETGLVTAALKIRRKFVEQFYKDDIDVLFPKEITLY